MFNIFNKDKSSTIRALTRPEELQQGDIVILKERRALPIELQGQQLEVTAAGTAQYSDGFEKELTLRSAENKTYYLSVDNNDGDPLLCFSIKIPKDIVLTVFDTDDFAQLWEEDFVNLKVKDKPEAFAAWLSDDYQQAVKDGEGYFYNRDCTDELLANSLEDDGEEFRFHECNAQIDQSYSFFVQIWQDGETDVFLAISTPVDVIADMLPHDN